MFNKYSKKNSANKFNKCSKELRQYVPCIDELNSGVFCTKKTRP